VDTANTIGAYDAKTRFSEILERVAGGEEFTITRHGSPIARLVPAKKQYTAEERRQAIQRMREISERNTLGGLKIKDLIREGRP
jgi:prevent-host-death family protein